MLNQSDIFAHFGAGKASSGDLHSNVSDSTKGRSRRATSIDDLDEDEKAIVEDEENESAPRNTILQKQPSFISGGAMRSE